MSTAKRGGRGRGRGRRENTIRETPHVALSSPVKEFKCPAPACQLSFSTESDMVNHKMTHSELYDYECGQCDLVFEKLDLLKTHFYSVHMEGTVEERNEVDNGDRNGATVSSADLQNNSAWGDDGDNSFGEDDGYDGGGGVSPDEDEDRGNGGLETNLTNNGVTGEEESLKKYQCDKCSKSYKYKQDLTAHQSTHTGQNPYICSECGKSFSLYRTMTDHLKRHNKDFQYFCEVFGCGKGFVKKQDRDRHEIRAHVPVSQRPKEKSNQCSICKKYFTQKAHLTEHMKIHSGTRELPFPCELCGKRFGKKSGLETHMMSIKHGGTGVSYRNKKKPKKSAVSISRRGRKRTVPERFVQKEESCEESDDEKQPDSDNEYLPPGEKRLTAVKTLDGDAITSRPTGPTLMLATSSPPQRLVQATSNTSPPVGYQQQQGGVIQQTVNTGYWRSSSLVGQQQQQIGSYPHHQQQNHHAGGVPIAVLTLQDAFQNGYGIIGGNASASS